MSNQIYFYYKDGSILDYLNDSKILHREDGPAFVSYYENGEVSLETYFLEDKRHRENGPAIVSYYENGEVVHEEYYLEGIEYSKEEYYKIIEEVNNMGEATRLTDSRKWVREILPEQLTEVKRGP